MLSGYSTSTREYRLPTSTWIWYMFPCSNTLPIAAATTRIELTTTFWNLAFETKRIWLRLGTLPLMKRYKKTKNGSDISVCRTIRTSIHIILHLNFFIFVLHFEGLLTLRCGQLNFLQLAAMQRLSRCSSTGMHAWKMLVLSM